MTNPPLTREEREELRTLIASAGLTGRLEFENDRNGNPYNLQVPTEIDCIPVHPHVLMKTQMGWEPKHALAALIVVAVNNLPRLLAAVDAMEGERELHERVVELTGQVAAAKLAEKDAERERLVKSAYIEGWGDGRGASGLPTLGAALASWETSAASRTALETAP